MVFVQVHGFHGLFFLFFGPRITRIKHELHEFYYYFIFGTKHVTIICMKNIIYQEESYNIIHACLSVHKKLGCGFLEATGLKPGILINFGQISLTYKKLVL